VSVELLMLVPAPPRRGEKRAIFATIGRQGKRLGGRTRVFPKPSEAPASIAEL